MSRVAVQAGAAWVRVAVDEARPRLVAELPADGADLSTVLTGLLDAPADELLLVHRAGRRPTDLRVPGGLARAVRTVASAEAVAAEVGDAVVVDVGHGGAEVALVRSRRVDVVRRSAVGGARLDAVTARVLACRASPGRSVAVVPAAARRVREALSLQPAVPSALAAVPYGNAAAAPDGDAAVVELPTLDARALRDALVAPLSELVEAVRAVVAVAGRDPPPVLLVGGVARTPLLAELLDAAGIADVRVVERPDGAAVLGALRLPPDRLSAPVVGPSCPAVPVRPWLPPVAVAPHRGRRWSGALGALAAAGALLAAGAALPERPPGDAVGEASSAGQLVQYGYAVDLPAGWAHTGGLPERRRSLLTPLAAPDGSDLISVERVPVGYDTGAEPRRARAELRAAFDAAVAGGAPLTGFTEQASFAGRVVVAYREGPDVDGSDVRGSDVRRSDVRRSDVDGSVDWYVVLDGDAQLSVGCRHTRAGARAVEGACATVVGSLRRVP